MTPEKISGGDVLPIPIDKARISLRIDHTDEDTVLETAMLSACEWMEDETLLVATPSIYELPLQGWSFDSREPEFCHGDAIVLERAPLRRVISIRYMREGGQGGDVLPADFYTVRRPDGLSEIRWRDGWDRPSLMNRPGCVVVTFEAGYDVPPAPDAPAPDPESDQRFRMPRRIAQAVILLTGHWFENREESTDRRSERIVAGAESIAKQMRIWR